MPVQSRLLTLASRPSGSSASRTVAQAEQNQRFVSHGIHMIESLTIRVSDAGVTFEVVPTPKVEYHEYLCAVLRAALATAERAKARADTTRELLRIAAKGRK